MTHRFTIASAGLAVLLASATPVPALAAEQEAIDGCIDKLRELGGPDGQSGTVVSSDFSEAGTVVMLRDADGTAWRCLAYSDGTVGEMSVAEAADDGEGAMDGDAAGGTTSTERVKFAAGTTGTSLDGGLAAGSSVRYVLGARKNQFLYVTVDQKAGDIAYRILNPDGSELLGEMEAATPYRGQLWQSGDHVVEVINRGNGNGSFVVNLGIE